MAKKRKPVGNPIIRTDAELDALTAKPPTSAEIDEMIARTERVSPLLAALLRAKEVNPNDVTAAAKPAKPKKPKTTA